MVSALNKAINGVRGTVRDAVFAIGSNDVLASLKNAKCLVALREVSALRQPGKADNDFLALLIEIGFSLKGAKLILDGLTDQQAFQKSMWVALARLPTRLIETEQLNSVIKGFTSSTPCRKALVHAPHPALTPNDIESDKREFAPFLIRVFEENLFPELKASDLAQVHVYVRSGHAAADFMDPEMPIARLYQLLRDGNEVEHTVISGLVSSRLAELMSPVWVGLLLKPPSGGGPYPVAWAKEAGTNSPDIQFSTLIEALITEPDDNTTWHMANSSSHAAPDNDFLAMCVSAVENAIGIGFPPFKPADAIATLLFVAPSPV